MVRAPPGLAGPSTAAFAMSTSVVVCPTAAPPARRRRRAPPAAASKSTAPSRRLADAAPSRARTRTTRRDASSSDASSSPALPPYGTPGRILSREARSALLRRRLEAARRAGVALQGPCCHDGLSARLIEAAGFQSESPVFPVSVVSPVPRPPAPSDDNRASTFAPADPKWPSRQEACAEPTSASPGATPSPPAPPRALLGGTGGCRTRRGGRRAEAGAPRLRRAQGGGAPTRLVARPLHRRPPSRPLPQWPSCRASPSPPRPLAPPTRVSCRTARRSPRPGASPRPRPRSPSSGTPTRGTATRST